MAIKIYQPQVGLNTPNVPERRAPTPVRQSFGEDVYQANAELGNTAFKISSELQNHLIEKKRQENEAKYSDLETSYLKDLQNAAYSDEIENVKIGNQEIQRPKGWLNRSLEQADGVLKDYDDYYQRKREGYILNAPTAEMAGKLGNALDRHNISMRDNIVAHQARQKKATTIKSLSSNIEQQVHNAANINNPNFLSGAVNDAMSRADEVSLVYGYDPETANKYRMTVAANVVQNSVNATLNSTKDLVRAQSLLDSVRDKINPDTYDKLNSNLITGFNTIQKQQIQAQTQAKIQNRYDYLLNISNGNIDWKNMESQITKIAASDPDLAQTVQNLVQSEGAYLPNEGKLTLGNLAFMDLTKKVLDKNDPKEISDFLVKTLKESPNTNVGMNNLGMLLSVAKQKGDEIQAARNPQVVEDHSIIKSAIKFFEKVNPNAAPTMFVDFMKRVFSGKLHGKQIEDEKNKVMKRVLINEYPEIGNLDFIPNKISNEDSSIDSVYDGVPQLQGFSNASDNRATFIQDQSE